MNSEQQPPKDPDARYDLSPRTNADGTRLTLGRIWRITRKELRETLRDRRTIVTLLLMPLLVYPLLSLAFRQFLLSSHSPQQADVTWTIGVMHDSDYTFIEPLLQEGEAIVNRNTPPSQANENQSSNGSFVPHKAPISLGRLLWWVSRDKTLEEALSSREIDVGLKIVRNNTDPDLPPLQCEILYLPDSAYSAEAARYFEQRFRAVNEQIMIRRLELAGQSTVPLVDFSLHETERDTYTFPMETLVPLILILMTITGAVYPAIDLTAGERERGTLESLVASPMSRFVLLIGKYVAVLAVAILTALMNVTAMTITVNSTGLSRIIFGSHGLSLTSILAVFGLMVLFAGFFSALLLALTSFARSFKEAQAYLIPLMLVSMTPGFLSAVPGVKLEGWWAVTPLANIVLLARDIMLNGADPSWAIVALASTFIYGFSALVIAAQIFGNDAILYGSQESWEEWAARPKKISSSPSFELSFLTLALIFPLYVWLSGQVALWNMLTLQQRLIGNVIITALLFVGIPLVVCYWRRVSIPQAFQLRPFNFFTMIGAFILGCSMLPIAIELVLFSNWLGLSPNFDEQKLMGEGLIKAINDLPLPLILLCLAVVPAICEELFFRGFFFTALSRRANGTTIIFLSGIIFGLLHVLKGSGLEGHRLFSTTAIGIVLAWVALRSGSVFPGMLTHLVHNALPLTLATMLPWLKYGGDVGRQTKHVPWQWHLMAAIGLAVGGFLVWWSTEKTALRRKFEAENNDIAAQ